MIARAVAALATTVLTATLVLPGAANAMPTRSAEPSTQGDSLVWEPYRTSGFTAPAGQLCDFTLKSEPLVDEEMVATVARFPDGSPRVQAFKGKLVMRFTNVESGAWTDEDLSGYALMRYFRDGSYTMYLYGPVGVGFEETDLYPRGFYVLDGFHVVHTGPDRTDREILVDGGTEHDVCDDLS